MSSFTNNSNIVTCSSESASERRSEEAEAIGGGGGDAIMETATMTKERATGVQEEEEEEEEEMTKKEKSVTNDNDTPNDTPPTSKGSAHVNDCSNRAAEKKGEMKKEMLYEQSAIVGLKPDNIRDDDDEEARQQESFSISSTPAAAATPTPVSSATTTARVYASKCLFINEYDSTAATTEEEKEQQQQEDDKVTTGQGLTSVLQALIEAGDEEGRTTSSKILKKQNDDDVAGSAIHILDDYYYDDDDDEKRCAEDLAVKEERSAIKETTTLDKDSMTNPLAVAEAKKDDNNKEAQNRRCLHNERHSRRRRKAMPSSTVEMTEVDPVAHPSIYERNDDEDLEGEVPTLFQGREGDIGQRLAPSPLPEGNMSPPPASAEVQVGAIFIRGLGNEEGAPSRTGNARGHDHHHVVPSSADANVLHGGTTETPFAAFVVDDTLPAHRRRTHQRVEESPEEQEERIRRIILDNAPLVEGVIADDGTSSWKGYFHHNLSWMAVLTLIVIVAVTIGATLGGIYVNHSSDNDEKKSTQPSSPPPTQDPLARFESIKSLLISDQISTMKDLEDPLSPQGQALAWVAYNDSMQVDWQEDVQHLLQRYVLATFFSLQEVEMGFGIKTMDFSLKIMNVGGGQMQNQTNSTRKQKDHSVPNI